MAYIIFLSLPFPVVKLVGGGFVINGATPSSFHKNISEMPPWEQFYPFSIVF